MHTPVALDLGILRGDPCLDYIGQRSGDRGVCGLDCRLSLLNAGLGVGGGGTCGVEISLSLVHFGLERRGVEARDQLAFGHFRIEVGVQGHHNARYLRTNLHGDDRVRVTGGRNSYVNVAVANRRRSVLNSGIVSN